MNKYLLSILVVIGAVSAVSVPSYGQTASRLLKEADAFFERGFYREALQYYKKAGNEGTWDKDTRLKVAISKFEVNDLDGSIQLLEALDRDYRTQPLVFFYLARAYQFRGSYDKAITYYKSFIRESSQSNPRRSWVKDEIIRCGSGNHIKFAEPIAYVENLGSTVNTFYDERSPVPSPLYEDRIYFSSARPDSEGGLVDPSGEDDLKYGRYRSDMFFCENQNGIWRSPQPLDDVLNTAGPERILTFSADGQRLYYAGGRTGSDLMIDTFTSVSATNVPANPIPSYFDSRGDRDLYMFNDSIVLFASDRPGGHGGYDLYFSVRRDGEWQAARNLGPGVNSFYNEVSPFLTKSGRKLYFSSNRLGSIGGRDIFSSVFSDSLANWSTPVNLGVPINSAGDDDHFRIAGTGLVAYFSSDRKESYGGFDLYAVYMREVVKEHLMISFPISFIQSLGRADDKVLATSDGTSDDPEVKEYFISDLLFETNDLVLTPQNVKKLEVIANLLLIYPEIRVEFVCHDVATGPESFNLYFSIKKAEQVAEFLERRGIAGNRILLRGCGSFYPQAVSPTSTSNPNIDRLNRRIEVRIRDAQDQPVELIYAYSNVPDDLESPRAQRFAAFQDSLVYRVQVAEVNQLYQNAIFEQVDDALVLWDNDDLKYRYFIGMQGDYNAILDLRDDLRTRGFGNAFIVAFLDGEILDQGALRINAAKYPELLKLLRD